MKIRRNNSNRQIRQYTAFKDSTDLGHQNAKGIPNVKPNSYSVGALKALVIVNYQRATYAMYTMKGNKLLPLGHRLSPASQRLPLVSPTQEPEVSGGRDGASVRPDDPIPVGETPITTAALLTHGSVPPALTASVGGWLRGSGGT